MLVLPHHPYSLQQLPKEDPEHVKSLGPPQEPSVETFTAEPAEGDAAGAEEDSTDDGS